MAKSNEDVIRLLSFNYLLDSTCGVNKILVISKDEITEDLSCHRLALISDVMGRVYSQSGWKIEKTHETPTLHLHITLDNQTAPPCGIHKSGVCKTFVCGVVRNADTKKREKQMTAQLYQELRQKDLREDATADLISATISLDLLHVAPSKCVTLDLKTETQISRGASNKGAAFFLYNYARVCTILQKHADLVADGLYPPLSELHQVAPLLLNNKAEMELLECCLEGYISVLSDLQSTTSHFTLPQPNKLCRFLASACHVISRYYRNHHVLTEPREHLVPVMHARLHLLSAVQKVMLHVFQFLDITPSSSMW